MYDDIPFDEHRHILVLEDVGLVGLYIKDCRCLSEIAAVLVTGTTRSGWKPGRRRWRSGSKPSGTRIPACI
jgi:hypothetical protein